MPYNESMKMKTMPSTIPSGFEERLVTVTRTRDDINFQAIIKSEKYTLRMSIRRNAYDEQSYGKVHMFAATGWVEVFTLPLQELPNSKEISYVGLPQDIEHPLYKEKEEIVSELMMQDSFRMSHIALLIIR